MFNPSTSSFTPAGVAREVMGVGVGRIEPLNWTTAADEFGSMAAWERTACWIVDARTE